MRKNRKCFLTLTVCMFLVFNLNGQSLKSGFEALNAYDLFKAKRIFQKKLKKNTTSIAAYGLAELYMKPKNIFQNADSAFVYIKLAFADFEKVKVKKRAKFDAYGYNQKRMTSLREEISSTLFQNTRNENTEQAYIEFIKEHYWALEIEKAMYLRDSIAFSQSLKAGNSADLAEFLNKYPTSSFTESARDSFYRLQFEEQTKDKTEAEFKQFLEDFPDNPYGKEADLALYKMAQDVNTVKAYHRFILTYPNSSFLQEAWKSLYKSYINEYGIAWIELFKKEYPDYPFMCQLNEEYALVTSLLLPYFNGSKWGYMNESGQNVIPAKFDYAELFSQGRAAVQVNEKYGFIDAFGKWIIQAQFSDASSFRSNLSVVYDSADQAGLINLFGEFVIEPNFEDIFIISDEFVWVENDEQWLLYNLKTKNFGKNRYQDVGPFANFLITVQRESDYAVINLKEEVILSNDAPIANFGELFYVLFEDSIHFYNTKGEREISHFLSEIKLGEAESLTPCRRAEKIGYLNPEGKMIIEPIFDTYPGWQFFSTFVNDHAKACDGRSKKFGLINPQGAWVIPARFDDLSFYSERIAIQNRGKWEYISKHGEKLNLGNFEMAESFVGSSGIVQVAGKFGLIDEKGAFILAPEMKQIIRYGENLIRFEDQENKLWICNQTGIKLFDKACESIDKIDENIIRLIADKQVFYYLIEEQKIVTPQGNE